MLTFYGTANIQMDVHLNVLHDALSARTAEGRFVHNHHIYVSIGVDQSRHHHSFGLAAPRYLRHRFLFLLKDQSLVRFFLIKA